MSNDKIKVWVESIELEFTDLPAKNVHSEDLLKRVAHADKSHCAQKDSTSFIELCELGVDLQKSLRAANCDSNRINTDPAMRLVMIQLGSMCDVGGFSNYSQSMDEINARVNAENESRGLAKSEARVYEKTPAGLRAGWAQAAQDGASNLTPLMNSLHKAGVQVVAEGAIPQEDAAVRLISHQMAHLTQTTIVKPDSHACSQLSSWCDAQRARQVVEVATMESTASAKRSFAP